MPDEPANTENAEETPDESAQPKKGCLATIIPVTTPGCASCLTAVFLVTTVITVWILLFTDPAHLPWRHSMSWPRIIAIVLLTIAIPLILYRLLLAWLEGERSPFPDLEYAWYAGLHALSTNGLAINSIPIYVFLGSRSEAQERAIVNGSGMRMRVEGVPEGPAPIHWYASPDAIFLFCSDSCWTSALASLREELEADAAASDMPVSDSPSYQVAAAEQPPTGESRPAEPPADGGTIRGTMELNSFVVEPSETSPASEPFPVPESGGEHRGTLMLDGGVQQPRAEARTVVAPGGDSPADGAEPVLVSPQYSAASLQELQFLCQLIRKVRDPVCGINAIVSLVQIESIHSSGAELEELQKAIDADLATIQYSLQLRCPVTALVVGLERERGFRELIRRVGRERAAAQRFGRKFDVRAVPTREELAALAIHVCGAFEDWAYTLFREEEALSRPGNTRLYELLAKVRCGWKARLGDILAGGFGCDNDDYSKSRSNLFSGCYLAATGDTADRQAFVKGVIDKLNDEQELVEWTGGMLSSNRFFGRLAALGTYAALLLMLTLAGMILYEWLS